tara:strand:- start:4708 stop:4977 length:270 start_codon:yes stop_codon:yes gene_type:complete
MKSEEQLIKEEGYIPVKYSKNNDQEDDMSIDREDNIKFKNTIIKAVLDISKQNLRLSPVNISKFSRYSLYEIELNLNEIDNIINGLGLE